MSVQDATDLFCDELLRSAPPEQSRLIPEFPVGDLEVKAVRSTLVLMHGDVLHDVRKLVEVGR
jgi:hypothetical protein